MPPHVLVALDDPYVTIGDAEEVGLQPCAEALVEEFAQNGGSSGETVGAKEDYIAVDSAEVDQEAGRSRSGATFMLGHHGGVGHAPYTSPEGLGRGGGTLIGARWSERARGL